MTKEQRKRLVRIRVDSKMGHHLSREDQKFCEDMWRQFPDEYPGDKEIFSIVEKRINPLAGEE